MVMSPYEGIANFGRTGPDAPNQRPWSYGPEGETQYHSRGSTNYQNEHIPWRYSMPRGRDPMNVMSESMPEGKVPESETERTFFRW
jgi:hypothetical protein